MNGSNLLKVLFVDRQLKPDENVQNEIVEKYRGEYDIFVFPPYKWKDFKKTVIISYNFDILMTLEKVFYLTIKPHSDKWTGGAYYGFELYERGAEDLANILGEYFDVILKKLSDVEATKKLPNIESMSVEDLTLRYNNDIKYDSHSVEARISRSLAKRELQKRGKDALKGIRRQMGISFPPFSGIDYDLFLAYICLLGDLIEEHNLPTAPYDSKVMVGEQELEKWMKYCEVNG